MLFIRFLVVFFVCCCLIKWWVFKDLIMVGIERWWGVCGGWVDVIGYKGVDVFWVCFWCFFIMVVFFIVLLFVWVLILNN